MSGSGTGFAEMEGKASRLRKETAHAAASPGSNQAVAAERRVQFDRRLSANNRISPRYEVYVPCRIRWHKTYYDACIHDLSREGAFIETPAPPPDGSRIVICLKAVSAEVEVDATVIHRGWYMTAVRNFDGFGIRFRDLDQPAGDLLKEILRRSSVTAAAKITLIH
jgi:hypothetical protein